ncbi:MAG: hypothetical protein NTX29_07095 [Actinobacteria bacterium]|nr:hypothetical protein [Actinomycetota bacterium]
MVEDVHNVRDCEHHVHVVLYQEQPTAVLGTDAYQELTKKLGLSIVQTRSWFIKKQDRRSGRQRPKNANATLNSKRELGGNPLAP